MGCEGVLNLSTKKWSLAVPLLLFHYDMSFQLELVHARESRASSALYSLNHDLVTIDDIYALCGVGYATALQVIDTVIHDSLFMIL